MTKKLETLVRLVSQPAAKGFQLEVTFPSSPHPVIGREVTPPGIDNEAEDLRVEALLQKSVGNR